jgi:hypothetical protein
MTSQKVILIESSSTILNNGFFVKDEIPRVLASYIDDKYTIWMLKDAYQDYDILNYSSIPFWLKENIVILDSDMLNYISKTPLNSKSFILTNDVVKSRRHNLGIDIITMNEMFETTSFQPLKIADLVLCFGFNIVEFIRFCSETKMIGVNYEDKAPVNQNEKKPTGVAIMISNPCVNPQAYDSYISNLKNLDINNNDTSFLSIPDSVTCNVSKQKNVKSEYKFGLQHIKTLIKEKKYKVQHDNNVIGVTYKGNGLYNLNLKLDSEYTLPMLFV